MTDREIENDVRSSDQQSFVREIRREIRKQLAGTIVRWALIVGGGLIVLALVGWWLYLKPYIIVEFGGVPRGGVLAFDRDDLNQKTCPPGWSPFVLGRGRVLVGAGDPSTGDKGIGSDDRPLTVRNLRDSGGAEQHKLDKTELPAHIHAVNDPGHQHRVAGGYSTDGGTKGPGGGELTVGNYAGGDHYSNKKTTGIQIQENEDGMAHENMPPYIALFFCKRNGQIQ